MILDLLDAPILDFGFGGLDLEIWSNKNKWEKKEIKNKKKENTITVPAPKDSITWKIIFGGFDI